MKKIIIVLIGAGFLSASTAHGETKRKVIKKNIDGADILSVGGIRFKVSEYWASDAFQNQYGLNSLSLNTSKPYEDPADNNMLITAGYLKEILDRLENEIQQMRDTIHQQNEEITTLQMQMPQTQSDLPPR